jgi:glucose/arabinose dehydrogenase
MRALVVLACLALAGCSDLAAPTTTTSTTVSKLAQAQRTHEYRSAPPPPQRANAAAPSPQMAIRAFASAYINWNAQSVAADMRMLAARSVGQARSAMQLAAVNTAQDYELQHGGIANAGTVEAIAPLLRGRGRYVVVTLERTTASNTTAYQGLRPAWHLAIATVIETAPNQWVLSGWQPEN